MKKPALLAFLAAANLTAVAICWADAPNCGTGPLVESTFDFDDNIFVTPAQLGVWDSANQIELMVSTGYWALLKPKIGQKGPYEKFVVRDQGLREFGDDGPLGQDLFKSQIARALANPSIDWHGPRWNAFVRAMSCPETRAHAAIITAREHPPTSILAGLQLLKEKGLVPAVPDAGRIYPVKWAGLPKAFQADSDAASKANVMKSLLDKLESEAIRPDAPAVENPDGDGLAQLHLWSFSDDDFGNFSGALAALSPQVKAGRWPHVKITLFYTGLNNPEQSPYSIVIKSDGSTRATSAVEAGLQ